jgi:predicted MPP superfamily phosphohydrolase
MLKYLATESTRSVAAIRPLRLSGAQRHLSLILGSVPENGELRVVVLKERLMKKSRDSEVLRRRNKGQRAIIRLLKKMHRGGFEPSAFEIGHVEVTIPDLDPAFRGYRIASIADIHLDEWLNAQRFDEVIDLINQQHPDLVAIVGDLFSYEVDGLSQQMVVSLNKLRPKDCSVAVLGNHDHLVGATAVRDVLSESNVIDVSNDVMTVNKGQATLHVAGVDSVAARKHRLDKVLKKLPPIGPAILLAHEPDFADVSASTGRFSLQISGHSHGGQWIVPGIGPPIRGLYSRKYPLGRYRVGDMTHYTNRGIGTSIIRMRINCPPEITVFTLTPPGHP